MIQTLEGLKEDITVMNKISRMVEGSVGLHIRRAVAADAPALYDLYMNHLSTHPAEERQDLSVWCRQIAKFEADDFYHLLVGEKDGQIISSVTVVIIQNLTHNLRPYAVIENVVTHASYRGKGYAGEMMNRSRELAVAHDCYKIMLLTGSKLDETLHFYEKCGYNRQDKTAFIQWL